MFLSLSSSLCPSSLCKTKNGMKESPSNMSYSIRICNYCKSNLGNNIFFVLQVYKSFARHNVTPKCLLFRVRTKGPRTRVTLPKFKTNKAPGPPLSQEFMCLSSLEKQPQSDAHKLLGDLEVKEMGPKRATSGHKRASKSKQ